MSDVENLWNSIRKYFPNSRKFSELSPQEVIQIVALVNNLLWILNNDSRQN